MMPLAKTRSIPRLLLLPCFFLCLSSFAQLRIAGPLCITPGTEYFYSLSGKTGKLNVCLNGGNFTGTAETCLKDPGAGFSIVWQDGAEKTAIKVSTTEGDTIFYIHRNAELTGGTMTGARKSQMFDMNKTAFSIGCTPAGGGPCNARYSYQWQSSDNCVVWTDVKGASEENLKVSSPPAQTTFYRRQVFEKVSNTIVYSDVATVFIIPVGITSVDVVIAR